MFRCTGNVWQRLPLFLSKGALTRRKKRFYKTIPHAIATTTMVRIAVARLELTASMPTFASIEVSAAKIADSRAKTNHIQDRLHKIGSNRIF